MFPSSLKTFENMSIPCVSMCVSSVNPYPAGDKTKLAFATSIEKAFIMLNNLYKLYIYMFMLSNSGGNESIYLGQHPHPCTLTRLYTVGWPT